MGERMDGQDNWILEGGYVLRDEELQREDLYIAERCIVAAPPQKAQRLDARELWVLPGIVDVHGDAFERIVMPRPGVTFPLPPSLAEADRQMTSNGITTAFHGLTVSWEPGLRSLEAARAFVGALLDLQDRFACDTRINFRWETYALDAVGDVLDWLDWMPGAILSINDHTTINLRQPAGSRKIGRMAERTGLSPADCIGALESMAQKSAEVPEALARLAAGARQRGVSILAHDEADPATRATHRALGILASEFPMNEPTARAAREAGEHVVLGAPNVLRGGSQNDALDATGALAAGLCTALSSDYWYPSLLLAPFVLTERAGLDFATAWDTISRSPAEIAGLGDRGRLDPGLRGDVIAVCPRSRTVREVFVAGRRKLSLA
jgi:alpha-D-ribose 1-methylphosphonate 5-triphosphate diphosphatase